MNVVQEFPYELTRAAFSARDAARAGDVWRAFQDAAVRAATQSGWSPRRLREVGSAFVVRSMVVVHHRETTFGEPLVARSWVSRVRRETISTREMRFRGDRGPLASASADWVHMDVEHGLRRMPPGMADDLGLVVDEPSIELPGYEPVVCDVEHVFRFRTFHTWMDPLDHVNHPQYVDFCDEATCQRMAARGIAPLSLAPVAEDVTFRQPVVADELVTVTTRMIGRTSEGAIVLSHRIGTEREPRCTDAITIRRVEGADPRAFESAFLER